MILGVIASSINKGGSVVTPVINIGATTPTSSLSQCYYPNDTIAVGDLMILLMSADNTGEPSSADITNEVIGTKISSGSAPLLGPNDLGLSYWYWWRIADQTDVDNLVSNGGSGRIQSGWTNIAGARLVGQMITVNAGTFDPNNPITAIYSTPIEGSDGVDATFINPNPVSIGQMVMHYWAIDDTSSNNIVTPDAVYTSVLGDPANYHKLFTQYFTATQTYTQAPSVVTESRVGNYGEVSVGWYINPYNG